MHRSFYLLTNLLTYLLVARRFTLYLRRVSGLCENRHDVTHQNGIGEQLLNNWIALQLLHRFWSRRRLQPQNNDGWNTNHDSTASDINFWLRASVHGMTKSRTISAARLAVGDWLLCPWTVFFTFDFVLLFRAALFSCNLPSSLRISSHFVWGPIHFVLCLVP